LPGQFVALTKDDGFLDTYHFLLTLWQHWTKPTHPVYRADSKHIKLTPSVLILWKFVRRVWRPIAAVGLVVLMTAIAEFLCGGGRRAPLSFSTTLFSLISVVGVSLALIAVLLLAYLWPLAVAIGASGVIASERERQTWDVLLTTPFDWADLILAKLAASLRRLNPYGEMLLWVQAFLAAILFVVVLGDFLRDIVSGLTGPVFQIALLVAAMLEFVVARAQDYVLSSLVGLIASLLTPNRQTAGAIALMMALALVLVRALLTLILLTALPPTPPPLLAVLIATGPASVIAMAGNVLLGIPALILMIVAREALIRTMFGWLVHHMGDATEAHVI
jgi:hypothetical protein